MTTGSTLAEPTIRGAEPEQSTERDRRRRQPRRSRFGGLLYVAPSFAILCFVMIAPIAMTIWFSFTNYSMLGSPRYNAGENYVRLLQDEVFWRALRQTAVYTLISVPLQTVVALLIANSLARRVRKRFGGFIRSALFVPVISSMVLAGTVWRYLLGADDGVTNQLLNLVGLPSVNWLGEPDLALFSIALVTVWKNIGYFLVIYYAGMMNIPRDLYEASSIDGATGRQQLFHITLPSLRPITFLVVILGTIWSFQVFDLVYTMTGGGPGGGTVTLVFAIYQAGFQNFQMGYASAIAVVLFAVVLVISIVQRMLLARSR